jgi:outer membrane protein OmpA-like peptidoglycan-associated protein
MKLKSIFAMLALGLASMSANAQQTSDKPNAWFLQGGLGLSYSVGGHDGIGSLLSPAGEVAVGKYFSPKLGARLAIGGWQGRVNNGSPRSFYHGQATVDGLWNISQTFSERLNRPVDLGLVVGVGFDRSYGYNASSFLARAGLQMSVRLSPVFDFNVEALAHGVSDRWNGLDDHSFDSYVNLLVGVTYRLGTGYKCKSCQPEVFDNDRINECRAPKRDTVYIERIVEKPVVVEQPAPQPVVAETLQRNVYFDLNKTNIRANQEATVREVGEFLQRHPDAKASLMGYADKGTGTAAINTRLAEQRANTVSQELQKTYGISASRLTVGSRGDLEQPFSHNESNRVVLIDIR